MLREEAAKLLMMIQGAYPNYKPLDKTVAVNTWHLALSDISFELAQQAFLAYLRSDTSGFAPAPGQLIALVHSLHTPKQMNAKRGRLLKRRFGTVHTIQNQSFPSYLRWFKRRLVLRDNYDHGRWTKNITDRWHHPISCVHIVPRQSDKKNMPDNLKQLIDQTNANSYSTQIQQKNQEVMKITLKGETAKIEANEEITGISQQCSDRLQNLKATLQSGNE